MKFKFEDRSEEYLQNDNITLKLGEIIDKTYLYYGFWYSLFINQNKKGMLN